MLFSGLPAVIVNRWLLERKWHIIGGLMSTIAVLATAFTNKPWQGMLCFGVLGGEQML